MSMEQINNEIRLLMEKYKDAYHKSKLVEGLEKKRHQQEMERCTRRLLELLAEKRKLKLND